MTNTSPGTTMNSPHPNPYLEKSASMHSRAKYNDTFKKGSDDKPKLSSLKYDGASYFLCYDHYGIPTFVSRRPSVTGAVIEKADRVPHLAKTLPSQAGKVYNVELIHTGHDPYALESHARVSGLLNSLPERSIREQSQDGPIRAVVFDMIEPRVSTFNDKLPHIQGLISDFGDTNLMFHPEYAHGVEGMNALIEKSKKEGREGVITLDPTAPEAKNPRVKLKHKNHYNLKVKAILQEKDISGKPKPSAGALLLEDATGREVGKVGTGFDRRTREDIFKHPNAWLNKLIQVEAMTPTGTKLRQPVYNGDADGELDTV
jgi:hypothetical protein